MFEGKRVLAGEAILDGLTTAERDRPETRVVSVESLVREYSRLVYRIAYAVLRSHHDAEDVAQETFMRVLRYGSKLGQIEDPKPWLARIAWRVAVDRIKKRGRICEVPIDDPEKMVAQPTSTDMGADEILRGAQIESALATMIAALPSKLREPLVLSTLDEMTPREVGAALGINEAAVRSRVFRARQILKEKLAQRLGRK